MCRVSTTLLAVCATVSLCHGYEWPAQPWLWYQRQYRSQGGNSADASIRNYFPAVNSEVTPPQPEQPNSIVTGEEKAGKPALPKITREALLRAIDEMKRVTSELGTELQPVGRRSEKLWSQFMRILAKYAHEIKHRVVDYAVDVDKSHPTAAPTTLANSTTTVNSSATPSIAVSSSSATMSTTPVPSTSSGRTEAATTKDRFSSAVPVPVGQSSAAPAVQTTQTAKPVETTKSTEIVPPVVTITQAFVKSGLVPALVSQPPLSIADVRYTGGVRVTPGVELRPAQTGLPPTRIKWAMEQRRGGPSRYHTLMMVSPDMQDGTDRLHWLVVNIPDGKIAYGNTLAEYIAATPAPTTGPGLYVFLVFQQKEPIFDASIGYIPETSLAGRAAPQWSSRRFAEKHGLGGPVAGNIFMARCDKFSDALLARLGVTGVGSCGQDNGVQAISSSAAPPSATSSVIDNNLFANAPYNLVPMPYQG